MKAFLIDTQNQYTKDLLEYLKDKLREYFNSIVDYDKLVPFEIYINELPKYKSLFKKYITAYEICNAALYNIEILSTSQTHVLRINPVEKLLNTPIKIEELCKLINNGNLYLKAYPIFTKIFQYAQRNVDKIYSEYTLGEKTNVHKTL